MNKTTTLTHEESEFLICSNQIEQEYGETALTDAVAAWAYAKTVDVMTLEHVLEIHRLLMDRLNPRIAGKVRDCDVYIGGKRKIYISQALLKTEICDWCEALITEKILGEEAHETIAKDMHVWFEGLHPFEDGNGRVGRILYNWHRVKLGLPVHVIHPGKEQMEYYKWFKNN